VDRARPCRTTGGRPLQPTPAWRGTSRLIERHGGGLRLYWKSYDFAGNRTAKSLQVPLGPGPGRDTFQHAGSEIIFRPAQRPARLPAGDGKSNRIDRRRSPGHRQGSVKKGLTAEVLNGISCMALSRRGSSTRRPGPRAGGPRTRGPFPGGKPSLALYPDPGKLSELLREDNPAVRRGGQKTGTPLTATDTDSWPWRWRQEGTWTLNLVAARSASGATCCWRR